MAIPSIETKSMVPETAVDRQRQRAEKVAAQFEAVFVQTFVSSLRQTASVGGDSMFGKGPGADTYAGWFDQNLAEELGDKGGLGIKRVLLEAMAKNGDIDAAAVQADRARDAADRSGFNAATTRATGLGGLDGVR